MKHWMALSLLIPKALVEPVSNFLMEQGATGIEEVGEDPERKRLKTYFLQDGKEKKTLLAFRRYIRSLRSIEQKPPVSEQRQVLFMGKIGVKIGKDSLNPFESDRDLW